MISSSKQRYVVLFLYFILMCVLFCLPGSALPHESWLDSIWFDKWVHILLFILFTFLMVWAAAVKAKKGLMTAFLIAVIYGISVEIVQDQFIVSRSFDLSDWAADIVGSFIGIWFWNLRYIKK